MEIESHAGGGTVGVGDEERAGVAGTEGCGVGVGVGEGSN